MSAREALRFDASVCEGHFPGRPIVPGFLLLAAAWAHCAGPRAGSRPVAIGVRHARFRQTVGPGEQLSVTERSDGGAVRMDVRRDSSVVADAVFVTGELSRLAPIEHSASNAPVAGHELTSAELDSLLPHRPPMRMITSVEQKDVDAIVCTASIPFSCGIVSEGSATILAAVEAAAQAAALWASLRDGDGDGGDGPRMGYLVGVRDLAWSVPTIAAGQRFRVSARLTAVAEPLTHYAIEAGTDGEVLLQGKIATVLAG
jgi:3-hydroxymyristoyl/3-hydroxydecanoyl-(acyl carrier protein) dehydratase